MIFRAELSSAAAADGFAAKMVGALVAPAVACAGLYLRKRRTADTSTLSAHDLRDIGLAHRAAGDRAEYDLYDLLRPSSIGHRKRR